MLRVKNQLILHSTEVERSNHIAYLRMAEAALSLIQTGCDWPNNALYKALSYLCLLPGANIDINRFDYLYYSTETEVDKQALAIANKAHLQCAQKLDTIVLV